MCGDERFFASLHVKTLNDHPDALASWTARYRPGYSEHDPETGAHDSIDDYARPSPRVRSRRGVANACRAPLSARGRTRWRVHDDGCRATGIGVGNEHDPNTREAAIHTKDVPS